MNAMRILHRRNRCARVELHLWSSATVVSVVAETASSDQERRQKIGNPAAKSDKA